MLNASHSRDPGYEEATGREQGKRDLSGGAHTHVRDSYCHEGPVSAQSNKYIKETLGKLRARRSVTRQQVSKENLQKESQQIIKI